MRLLIASFPDDLHALEVALALRDRGHEVVIWSGGDFLTRQCASVEFEGAGARWRSAADDLLARFGAREDPASSAPASS